MRLTSFTDYGLRILMHVASHRDRPFTTAELATELQVSRNHLAKIVSRLASSGLLQTRRGGAGGLTLARQADDIRLGDVVALLESDQPLVECFAVSGSLCTLLPGCRLKGKLADAQVAFYAELNRSTLADCLYDSDIRF